MASQQKRLDLIDLIFSNMNPNRKSSTGILLAGDPGIGKTSFMKQFAQLMGLNLITVEVPHIIEEHIINVPFIVFNSATGQSKSDNIEIEKDGASFDIILSDSNLATEIKEQPSIKSDTEYLSHVYGLPRNIINLWEELGGDENTIPDEIKEIRDSYKTILFVDEFWRKTSPKIRNMFRTILNGDIGVSKIPAGTYVIYASNLDDTGGAEAIEDWTMNTDFATVSMDAPDYEGWEDYMISKHGIKKDGGLLDPDILKLFKPILEADDNLSYTDRNAEVRVSPRRWEQILVYISTSLPVDNNEEAQSLMTNVKVNFRNYMSGEYADLSKTVLETLQKYLEKKYKVSVDIGTIDERKWYNNLKHQLEQTMKAGKARSYIPVVSGAPGIAKTSLIRDKVSYELGLIYVGIDCSTLNKEDIVGIPVPGSDRQSLKFAKPKLLNIIEAKIASAKQPDPEKVKAASKINKGNFKYLLFFDELNRVHSVEVFNSLRRVILEKNFGDSWPLPQGTLIAAAINPTDLNTIELTDHLRDVTDIIPAGPSMELLRKYIKDKIIPSVKVKHEIAPRIVSELFEEFIKRFKSASVKGKDSEFTLDVGSVVYISPREYSTIVEDSIRNLDRAITRAGKVDDPQEAMNMLRSNVFNTFRQTLETVLRKHGSYDPNFFNTLKVWFTSNPEFNDLFLGLVSVKSKSIIGINKIIPVYLNNRSKHMYNDQAFVNYISSVDAHTLSRDVNEFIANEFDDLEKIYDAFMTDKAPQKNLVNIEKRVFDETNETISEVEYIIREIIHGMKIHNKVPGGLDAITEAVSGYISETVYDMLDKKGRADEFDKVITKLTDMFDKLTDYVENIR